MSYLTKPFRDRGDVTHSHVLECRWLAEELDRRGYTVDVVAWNFKRKPQYRKYDVLVGFGEVIEKAFAVSNRPLVIRYATGSDFRFQNTQAMKRLQSTGQEEKLKTSIRLAEAWPLSVSEAEVLLVIGNQVTLQTYAAFRSEALYGVPVPAFQFHDYQEIIKSKNFEQAKKNILFINSAGFVHKGLDLVLEAMKQFQDVTLHICAPMHEEKDFAEVFRNELNQPNIQVHGFVDMSSEAFKNILMTCGFIILPSCAEGQSSAVVNAVVNGGLIPVITKEAGLDITDEIIEISDTTIPAVSKAIEKAGNLAPEDIKTRSMRLAERFAKEHGEPAYKEALKPAFNHIDPYETRH